MVSMEHHISGIDGAPHKERRDGFEQGIEHHISGSGRKLVRLEWIILL